MSWKSDECEGILQHLARQYISFIQIFNNILSLSSLIWNMNVRWFRPPVSPWTIQYWRSWVSDAQSCRRVELWQLESLVAARKYWEAFLFFTGSNNNAVSSTIRWSVHCFLPHVAFKLKLKSENLKVVHLLKKSLLSAIFSPWCLILWTLEIFKVCWSVSACCECRYWCNGSGSWSPLSCVKNYRFWERSWAELRRYYSGSCAL